MTVAKDGLIYRNCVMSQATHPKLRYVFPEEFLRAKRKFIIIRECFATVMNSHRPQSFQVGDVAMHASFCWETANQYCCLVNSQMMKKKVFEVLGESPEFVIDFRTIDGVRIPTDNYLFDFCLKFQ
jgi:hypothetical protein